MKVSRYISLLFFCFFACAEEQTTLSMANTRPFEPRWEGRALSQETEKRLTEALNQEYRYLNAGVQSVALISKDGKYVLKFFKEEPFSPPLEEGKVTIPFLSQWNKEQKRKKREVKRDQIFTAYKTAGDRFYKETGMLYVHFNKTDYLDKTLTWQDALGRNYRVALDDCDFVVERRAEPLHLHLRALLEKGKGDEAGYAVRDLLNLHRVFYAKGMRNRDIEFTNNYGFVEEKPVLFDVGRLLPCLGQEGKEKYQKKLNAFLPAFRSWIVAFYPQLISSCDAAIDEIMSTLYIDPCALSMTSFHLYEAKWEVHALSAQEKKVVLNALSQPYRYLTTGGQSFVYASEDGKYILKFFREKIFSLPKDSGTQSLWTRWEKEKKSKQRLAKRERIYSAYALSFQKLAQETGILFVHLNQTQDLQKSLNLYDPLGRPFSVELDECDFILEKRAVSLQDHLDSLLEQGEVKQAGEALKSLLEMHYLFYQKGVRNRDKDILHNFGFVDGQPVLFDVGRLLSCDAKSKEKYQKKLKKILPDFRIWIAKHYPILIPYCDSAIATLTEKLFYDN
ncbi:MAG TPA: hypothetical protein VGJ00_07885 [Rhabdochlamydiaceae bacterium]|jgi:hypothetical protein